MSAASTFRCGFAGQLRDFVDWRRTCGVWNKFSATDLHLFDEHCASLGCGDALTQEALDSWCARRRTESAPSCASRTSIARAFAEWAHASGLTDAVPPRARGVRHSSYVPHSFTDEELARFFDACDTIEPRGGHRDTMAMRLICPALFRLLLSSGIRTTEARHLRRSDVDLENGVLSVRRSKGPDQHYVALHPSMTAILRGYDAAAESAFPGRTYLFEAYRGGHLKARWVSDNFRKLWKRSNGDPTGVRAYDLRHEYAVRNIMSWDCDPFEQQDRLLRLSRSMGHRSVSSTLGYFSTVPALADKLLRLTGEGMDAIVPDVWEGGDTNGQD